MPPKSASKKERLPWWNCERCRTYLPTAELPKHQSENCANIDTLSAYVSSDGLFHCQRVEIGDLSASHVEVKQCTASQRYGLVLFPISVARKLGLATGDFVRVTLSRSTEPLGSVVRVLWPTEDLSGPRLALEALDEFELSTNERISACVTPLDCSRLEDAEEITLHLTDPEKAALFRKNGKFLLSCLKERLKGSVVLSENVICLDICNKRFAFDIVSVRTAGTDLAQEMAKMSLTDGRMFVILRTTRFVLRDDSDKAQRDHQNQRYALANIGALDGIMSELRALIDTAFGMGPGTTSTVPERPISRGILIYGVSGVGKTVLVNTLATHYARCHVVRINCSEVFSKFYGESEANVSRLFTEVFDVYPKPALVIVEELHNLCPKSAASDIVKRASQHFLNLLDGLHATVNGSRTMVLGTTDNVDNVNALLRRGGRLDYEFELPVPDAAGRESILQRILARFSHRLSADEIRSVASITHGYVGADLENVVANAAASTTAIDGAALLAATQHVKASAMREIMIECPNVRWSDIGGQDELKLKLRQIIDWPIHHPEVFERLGIKPPRGLLMFGPPGCSKTMIAKAIATESRLNFLSIKGSELFSMWVGESERAVRDLFRRARQVAPSIIFFDELDAIGGERSGEGGGSSVKERVLAQLLTEMDGVSVLKDVRIVAATNRPDLIDRALMRPGRLDRIVYVRLPDDSAREEIFRIKLKTIPTAPEVDVHELVRRTAGCSGSEIEAICQEAALRGLEQSFDVQTIEWAHFAYALETVRPRTSSDLLRLYDDYLKRHQ